MDTARTILLVDDDPTLRTVFEALLRKGGYSVLSAPGGEQALRLLAAHPGAVSAIITDLHMPLMNGITLLEKIAAAGIHIPTILITGEIDELPADTSSITAVLTKPVTGGTVLSTLKRVLKQKP